MANFGFTPGDSDGSEEPVDFAAMMAQMQKQIQEQFSMLGINGPGFTGSDEALPKNSRHRKVRLPLAKPMWLKSNRPFRLPSCGSMKRSCFRKFPKLLKWEMLYWLELIGLTPRCLVGKAL
jgi:hypothetical protein